MRTRMVMVMVVRRPRRSLHGRQVGEVLVSKKKKKKKKDKDEKSEASEPPPPPDKQEMADRDAQYFVEQLKTMAGIGPLDETAQWLRLTYKDQKRHRVVARGSIAISVEILPKEDADNRPAGAGISEPNQNPTLPPRTGRMALSTNPFAVLQKLFEAALRHDLLLLFCLCVFLCLWFYLGMYYASLIRSSARSGLVGGDDDARWTTRSRPTTRRRTDAAAAVLRGLGFKEVLFCYSPRLGGPWWPGLVSGSHERGPSWPGRSCISGRPSEGTAIARPARRRRRAGHRAVVLMPLVTTNLEHVLVVLVADERRGNDLPRLAQWRRS